VHGVGGAGFPLQPACDDSDRAGAGHGGGAVARAADDGGHPPEQRAIAYELPITTRSALLRTRPPGLAAGASDHACR
jgi:hypothetical protein